MEIFRQIDERFGRLEAAQASLVEQTEAMAVDLHNLTAGHKTVLAELQGLRGTFAGMEAIMVANNARMSAMEARIEALEQKAS